MKPSPIERIQATNEFAEIWWDSSPLVFDAWRKSLIDGKSDEDVAELNEQLDRLMDFDGGSPGFRGCTTNPPLSLAALKTDPEFWNGRIDELSAENPDLDSKALSWVVYKDIIQRGAEAFRPLWEGSGGRYGFVSGQLDPRLFTEVDAMLDQAREISSLSPNVMVKVPASTQGIDVLRTLTSEGIPTNVTTCFTVPQVMAAARATVEGLAIAAENAVDTSRWRAVITLMLARLTERPVIKEQADYAGVSLSATDLKWLGLAVFKRAYRLLRSGGFPSKLLLCSVRPGPVVAGRSAYWDVEEVCGADIVYTLPPGALTPLFNAADTLSFRSEAIDDDVPADSMERLLQLPYVMQSYEPNGMSIDQFNTHPATLFTLDQFSKSASGLEDYVAARLAETKEIAPT
jgi:transaldolase